MLDLKKIIAVFLIAVIFGSFYYATIIWTKNKSEILIQASDYFNTIALPYRIAKLSAEPRDETLSIPIETLKIKDIENSWGAPRTDSRTHEGIDMFAERGTPVYSVGDGYVLRSGYNKLGGNIVFTIGAGGIRYYYAHLERIADGIELGTKVTKDTVLGFVGNSGNAEMTPPHLHFGMYLNGAENPYNLLINR